MSMGAGFLLGLLLQTPLFAPSARADENAACLDAASSSQKLLATQKLVQARGPLRACAALQCPAGVRSECARRLDAVDRALPSVVVAVRDGTGTVLVDVNVSVDGLPLTAKLDGRAVPIDAGLHTFRFDATGYQSLDRQMVVREGENDQALAVVLEASGAAQGPTDKVRAEAVEGSDGWKTLGWVLGAAGVVGLGMGTISGTLALEEKSSAHCDANQVCDPGTIGGIKNAALVSDVGWLAGTVLLATGGALVLFAPSGRGVVASGVRVTPVLTSTAGGIVARASW
jgi:hypothetical protein